jgi:mannose-1-phosphate guanylyltransferase
VSLDAVILVGGEGTRLRPLTAAMPKPMLPLAGRPLLAYTFDHLRRHGVGRAVLSCGYLPTQIEQHFGPETGGLTLEYRVEPEPLGTGGAIRFGAEGIDETFLALNGDSLRAADLDALIAFHRERGARATILLTPVPDPTRYGLVRLADGGRVSGFLEKPRPEEIDTDLINAGLYVLEPDVLDLVPPGKAVSIEREVFPRLVEEGTLHGLALPGYWLDVGTPESYLQAHRDVLERNVETEVGAALGPDYVSVDPTARVSPEARLVPPVLVGPDAVVAAGARVGSLAVVGAGATIGAGAVVEDAVIGAGALVGERAHVQGSLLGESTTVGADCEIRGLSVVGPGAVVDDGNMLDHGLRVGAGATIPARSLTFS